jgi:short-subunit dehydrogenase
MNKKTFLSKYGPWAIVTGASDGIGYAFAKQLAECGLNLVLVARNADRLNELAHQVRAKHGSEALVIAADLSTPEGLVEVGRATESVDVGLFVVSAGYGTSGPLLQANLEQERNMLDLNCYAVLQQCVVFGNRLAQRGGGGIILLASLVGRQGVARSAHYAATKAYVQSLAEALQIELRPKGIDVLASAPGPVRSGLAARANMVMGAAVDPAVVARKSLDALGKTGTVVPGGLSKLLTYFLLPLPRSLRSLILAKMMGGMTICSPRKYSVENGIDCFCRILCGFGRIWRSR